VLSSAGQWQAGLAHFSVGSVIAVYFTSNLLPLHGEQLLGVTLIIAHINSPLFEYIGNHCAVLLHDRFLRCALAERQWRTPVAGFCPACWGNFPLGLAKTT
jgi:hypothetical protein